MSVSPKRDLFILVADLDAKNAIAALVGRHRSIGIRPIEFDPGQDMLPYSGRDAGCCNKAVELLRGVLGTHQHSLAFFDRDGSGREAEGREAIEKDIEQHLCATGWRDRARVIVFEPEVEAWVWADSPHVAMEAGWSTLRELRHFLHTRNFLPQKGGAKPHPPKEAFDAALKEKRQQHTPELFKSLATKVGRLDHCVDPAFVKFLATLRAWFPAKAAQSWKP
jgi:hypothetical protein